MADLQQVLRLLWTPLPASLAIFGSAHLTLAASSTVWSAIPPSAVLETGDTWRVDAIRYRLYGVQACIRGTIYTDAEGRGHDCGNASLAMLAGLIRSLKPVCALVAQRPNIGTAFVVCTVETGIAMAQKRIDLGTALIVGGFAFAAVDADGQSVDSFYEIAEDQAKRLKVGLWTARDVPDPNTTLLRARKSEDPR